MKNLINSVNVPFSTAEQRVVELLSRGHSEKEIADKLCISPNTVNNHLRNVREKHGLSKNSEVILLYVSSITKRKFDLNEIRKYGVSVILVMLNVCEFNKAL